ncbi:hypothetical protein IWQ62_002943 [Dispira parvispora]|uniref:Uncharacterized protein n=1 Tax=Dispira parvispora TaxID=1520584 RepID=A0A9W8E260_9FUNG|nr:hypothetical protein IWQ62_002943 [Dispira parvispora]
MDPAPSSSGAPSISTLNSGTVDNGGRKTAKLIQLQKKTSTPALTKLKKGSGTVQGSSSTLGGNTSTLTNPGSSGPSGSILSRQNTSTSLHHVSSSGNMATFLNGSGVASLVNGANPNVSGSGGSTGVSGLGVKGKSHSHVNLLPLASAKSGGTSDIHPLQYTWVFWFMHRAPGQKITNYESGMKRIASFSSIEDFWAVYSHLRRPHELPTISDYHLFKQGVRPVWEDDVNKNGGKWIVRLKKGIASRYWESLILAVIGDQFDVGDDICGVVLSIRNSEDILSVWNKSAQNGKINLTIRDTIKRVLNLPADTVMEYKAHNDSMRDNSSFRNTDVYK